MSHHMHMKIHSVYNQQTSTFFAKKHQFLTICTLIFIAITVHCVVSGTTLATTRPFTYTFAP